MKNKTLLLTLSLFSVCATTVPGLRAADPVAPAATTTEPAADATEKKPQMDPAARMEKRLERMTQALALTAEQQKKIRDIYTAEAEAAKAERGAGAKLSADERKAKRTAAMEKSRSEIKAVLTPEQQTKFDSLKLGERRTRGPQATEAAVPAPAK